MNSFLNLIFVTIRSFQIIVEHNCTFVKLWSINDSLLIMLLNQ